MNHCLDTRKGSHYNGHKNSHRRRYIIREIQDYIPVTKAKNILLDIVRRVERDDETIAITKNGVPVAIILSMDKFKGLLETLDILSDEEVMLSLRKSIQEAKRGDWVSYKVVFGK